MEKEDTELLNDIQNVLNENLDYEPESDKPSPSLKSKTSEIKKKRKKETLILDRHLGYKRRYLKETKWYRYIFYISLIALCVAAICLLMPYKG